MFVLFDFYFQLWKSNGSCIILKESRKGIIWLFTLLSLGALTVFLNAYLVYTIKKLINFGQSTKYLNLIDV